MNTKLFHRLRTFFGCVWKDQRGLATMEMAMVLPVLTTLVLGTVDFGRLMYNQVAVTNASREGARQGILFTTPRPTDIEIQTVVQSALANAGWDPSSATITVTGEGGVTGSDLKVGVNYPFDFWVVSKIVPGLPDTFMLQANTLMKME